MKKIKSLAFIVSMAFVTAACSDNTSYVREGNFGADSNRTVEKVFDDYPYLINKEWYESTDNEIIFHADFSNQYLVDISSPADITKEQKDKIVDLLNKNKFKISFDVVFTTDKKTFEVKEVYASYNDLYLASESVDEINTLLNNIIKKEKIFPTVTTDAAMAYSYYNLQGYAQNNEKLKDTSYHIEYLADSYVMEIDEYTSYVLSPVLKSNLKLDFDDANKRITYTIKTDATTVNDLAAKLYGTTIYKERCYIDGVYSNCQFGPIAKEEFEALQYDVIATKETKITRNFGQTPDTAKDFGEGDDFRLNTMYKAAYTYPSSYSEIKTFVDGDYSFNLLDKNNNFTIETQNSGIEDDQAVRAFLNLALQMDNAYEDVVAVILLKIMSQSLKVDHLSEADILKYIANSGRAAVVKNLGKQKLPPFIFTTNGKVDDIKTEKKWGGPSVFSK